MSTPDTNLPSSDDRVQPNLPRVLDSSPPPDPHAYRYDISDTIEVASGSIFSDHSTADTSSTYVWSSDVGSEPPEVQPVLQSSFSRPDSPAIQEAYEKYLSRLQSLDGVTNTVSKESYIRKSRVLNDRSPSPEDAGEDLGDRSDRWHDSSGARSGTPVLPLGNTRKTLIQQSHPGNLHPNLVVSRQARGTDATCPKCHATRPGELNICYAQGHFTWCMTHANTALLGEDSCPTMALSSANDNRPCWIKQFVPAHPGSEHNWPDARPGNDAQ